MFTPSLSAEEQTHLAQRLTCFLSLYTHLSDSYIIEFFTEDLWQTLPSSWRPALQDLTYPQIADLLLDPGHGDRRYPSVWPLSLLAFRSTAHALAFPRVCRRDPEKLERPEEPEEFEENQSQSSLLDHIFRKHVKPKKQHEIRKLGTLVKQLCDETGCSRVVDVGSGQGHLTRFLSFGLRLSVTAVEADHALVATANKFDGELLTTIEKENRKKNISSPVPLSQYSPRHVAGWVNPKASWEAFVEQLSPAGLVGERTQTPCGPCRKRQRGLEDPEVQSCTEVTIKSRSAEEEEEEEVQELDLHPDFVLTGLHACGDLSSTLLRHFICCPHVQGITSVACCYMKITTREHPAPPGLVPNPAPDRDSRPPSEFGYPMSRGVGALLGHQLSYKAREAACHAVEDYVQRLREESALLRTHCYRAALETFIRATRPDLRRAGIQTIKKAHLLPFTEYARLGLARVGLPPSLPLDPGRVEALLQHQGRVVVYFSLALLLAPVVETLVLLDRIMFLQENGVESRLVPLFDPNFSPRNFVLVALKNRR